jgi:hypothetical protein
LGRVGPCGTLGGLVHAVALAVHLDDLGLCEKAVEDGGGRRDIAEEGAPVSCGSVCGDDRRGLLVPAHEDLEQVFGRAGPEPLHAEVLDHQEVDLGEALDERLALAQRLGLEEVLRQIEGAAHQHARRSVPKPAPRSWPWAAWD